ncbi:MAG: acyl-CoA dehydrogenase, partial [Proteobacteria bacterium]|nr:acyl-CoA dehydrogenase [Pseudomonadota bacterium]
FQMMNEARIDVGMSAAAIASAAYYASLEFARERPQGRKIESKDPTSPPVMIIEHADIKRILMFQRAVIEGALGILLQCGIYADMERVTEGEEKERYTLLLDLLTPIAKSYPSEMGVITVSQGLQILGGSGFTDEYTLEQHYRDQRINPIHEGTTGIQGLDLLGRKLVMKDGRAYQLYLEEVRKTAAEASADEALEPYARRLESALETMDGVTRHLLGIAASGRIELFTSDATLYLEMFGHVTVAWQWLKQGLALRKGLAGQPTENELKFYQGKWMTMQFFFHYELPKIQGLATRLLESDGLTIGMKEEYFED